MSNPFARNEGNAQGFGQQGGYPGVAQGGYQQGFGQGGYAPGQYQGGFPQGAPQQGGKSKTPLIIGIIAGVVVIAIIVGVVIWAMSGSDSDDSSNNSAPAPVASAPANPGGGSTDPANPAPGNPQATNNTNPSAAPTQGNATGANGMLSMTPYGATNLYEITDISYGPKADNNEQTIKVTFKVTNKGNAPEFGGMYPRAYQNGEQLGSPNFFMTQKPDDFEYVPGVADVPAGQSVQYVVYWVIPNKRDPIEFRDPNWTVLQAQGQDYQKWTWQPK